MARHTTDAQHAALILLGGTLCASGDYLFTERDGVSALVYIPPGDYLFTGRDGVSALVYIPWREEWGMRQFMHRDPLVVLQQWQEEYGHA